MSTTQLQLNVAIAEHALLATPEHIALLLAKHKLALGVAAATIQQLTTQLAEEPPTEPTPEPPAPPSTQPEHPPPADFKGTWSETARELMTTPQPTDKKDTIKNAKSAITCFIKHAGDADADPDINRLWATLTDSVLASYGKTKLGSLNTEIGRIKTVTKKLHIPDDQRYDGFQHVYRLVKAEHKAEKAGLISEADVRALFTNTDGTIFHLQLLRDWVHATVADPPTDTADRYDLMVAALLSIGHRQQDFADGIGYGEANKASDGSYYDPDTHTFHLYNKKTDSGAERTFAVPDDVATAMELYHATGSYDVVLPVTEADTNRQIRKSISRTCERNGWPLVLPTTLRCLYETDIRFINPIPKEELAIRMVEIGHSESTAEGLYCRYSNLVKLLNQSTPSLAPAE